MMDEVISLVISVILMSIAGALFYLGVKKKDLGTIALGIIPLIFLIPSQPGFTGMTEMAYVGKTKESMGTMLKAKLNYERDMKKPLNTANDLIPKYVSKIPKDAWETELCIEKNIVSSAGKDRVFGNEDDIRYFLTGATLKVEMNTKMYQGVVPLKEGNND